MSDTLSLDELLRSAHDFADISGAAILPFFRTAMRVEDKADGDGFDPVTEADRASERAIDEALRERWPDHGLIGEEFGERNSGARFRWIVDPIDGTRAFITGSPLWGTLIGVLDGGRPILGMMNQPFTGERFWGSAGGSLMRRGAHPPVALATSGRERIEDAILTTTHPDLFSAEDGEAFGRLKSTARMTRYGGDCYAYCLLAAGFIDLVVETGLKPYDIAALIPIVENAGGCVTTWDGASAADGGRIVASANRRLHDAALDSLAG